MYLCLFVHYPCRERGASKNQVPVPVISPSVRFSDLNSSKEDGLTQLSIARRHTEQYSKQSSKPTLPYNHNWKALGGPGRDPHNFMIIKLSKVKLQHEAYPTDSEQSSRFVLLVNDIEVLDKLKSSSINKFLHVFTSEAMPRPTHANMVSTGTGTGTGTLRLHR